VRAAFVVLLWSVAAVLPAHGQDSIPDPRTYWLDYPQEQAARSRIDYRALLDGATSGDSAALARLFAITGLDGVGAEAHAEVLWALLRRWGDRPFARVLQHSSRAVRGRVLCYIDLASPSNWSRRFPTTFRLAPHEARCHGW
jgi:hypothetical protein